LLPLDLFRVLRLVPCCVFFGGAFFFVDIV
jgi:hypothetical protein